MSKVLNKYADRQLYQEFKGKEEEECVSVCVRGGGSEECTQWLKSRAAFSRKTHGHQLSLLLTTN